MARLDSFDVCAFKGTWFDIDFSPVGTGWWDRDLVPPPAVPPPPPPPPPKPKPFKPTKAAGSGGGSGNLPSLPYRPPEWLEKWVGSQWLLPADEPEEQEPDTDFALLHISEGVSVKALADGVVESFVSDNGRTSVTLKAADGTRYWYADIGKLDVADGAHVRTGDVIAHARAGSPVEEVAPPLLPPHDSGLPALPPLPVYDAPPERKSPPPLKPTQVVFVEGPPEEPLPLPALPPLPALLPPPRMLVRLVPIAPPSAPSEDTVRPMVVRVAISLGVVGAIAALLYALSKIQPTPAPPKKKRKRKRKKRW